MADARRHQSIRTKLTRILFLTSGIAVVAACTISGVYDIHFARQDGIESLLTLARVTGANSTAALTFHDANSAAEILSSLRTQGHIVHAVLYSLDGSTLATFNRDSANRLFSPPAVRSDEADISQGRIHVFQTVLLNGRPAGTIYLESDLSAITAREKGLVERMLLSLLGAIAVVLLIAQRLQRSISEPILDLARTAFAISVDKNFSTRAVPKNHDEIGFLYEQFNEMLDRIQERDVELEQIRAQLEQRVIERTAHLSALIETSPLAIVVTDQRGAAQSINPEFTRIFGYNSSETTGAILDDLIAPGEISAEAREITRRRLNGERIQKVTRRRRKDGSFVDVELHGVPLNIHGEMVGGYAIYQDITERTRAEAELREREEQIRLLMDSTAEAIYGIDLEGRCTLINRSGVRMLGYKDSSELLGKNMHKLVHHSWADGSPHPVQDCQIFRAFQKAEGNHDREDVFWRRDGTSFPSEYWSYPVWRNGEVVGSVVTFLDISEQIKAEKELRETSQTMTAIIEASPLAIVGLDRDAKVFMWNPAAERIFGWTASEAIGRLIPSVPDEARGIFQELHKKILNGQGVSGLEVCASKKNGSVFDVSISRAPLRDATGAVRGTVDIAEDITERKRAERMLNKLSKAVEQTAENIVITDKDGIIEYVNPSFERVSGYSKEYAIGKTPRIVKSGKHELPFYQEFWKTILSGEPYRGVFINKKKNGDLFYEEQAVAALKDAKGAITNFVAVGRDITARKQAEIEVRNAKEAAEAANRAKSEFLANMSHEIRTPMNGILGMTELALETPLNGEQREYLEAVKSSADSLLTVINDILDFSKIEAGKLEFDLLPFALRRSLGETTRTLGHVARRKGLRLDCQVGPTVPEWLVGDVGRLRQVVINLVGNAIKFTERGEVTVQVDLEEKRDDAALLHFIVRDTGIGIPTEKLKIIFDAFTQADSSTTRKYGGTGLGLAISNRLVQMMSGKIWAKSVTGQGSEFHFTALVGLPGPEFVPAETSGKARRGLHEERKADVVTRIEAKRILVVEDNAVSRQLIVRLLEKHGYTVLGAQYGGEALSTLDKERVDMLLTDWQMPDCDGLELIEKIRRREKLAGGHLPIIVATAHAMKLDREKCFAAGADGYISKPVNHNELLRSVDSLLQEQDSGDARDQKELDDSTPPIEDEAALLQHVAGDRELLGEIVQIFRNDSPAHLREMKKALDHADTAALARFAHTLKGALGNFGNGPAFHSAQEMEALAKGNELESARAFFQVLEREVERLQAALERYGSTVVN